MATYCIGNENILRRIWKHNKKNLKTYKKDMEPYKKISGCLHRLPLLLSIGISLLR